MGSGEVPGTSWTGAALSVDVLHSRPGLAQQIWVGTGHAGLLVDVGDGGLRDLLASGREPKSLTGLVFTHGHFDHMGGLHSLLGFLRMVGRTEPLPILGPIGCTELWSTVDTFRGCYASSIPFEIAGAELADRQRVEIGDVTIEAFAVLHCGSISTGKVLDPIPAMGYRISRSGETVAITGDTGRCDSLPELVSGADLALVEATCRDSSGMDPEVLARVHLSADVAVEIGRLAKRYMLVHKGRWA